MTQNPDQRYPLHIGMRNIKTAIAATLCALFYLSFNWKPTFACIGAIFGIGNDLENSWLNGGNRLFGTMIGGFIGMGLYRLYIVFFPSGALSLWLLPFLFVGVIVMILISQLLKWPGAIQPGGVILCILLFSTPVETYVSYSLQRIFDTGIGVAVALLINLLLPRERMVKILETLKLRPIEK